MASLSKRRKRERACDDTVQRGKADRDTGNNTFTEQDRMWEWCGISDPLEKTIKVYAQIGTHNPVLCAWRPCFLEEIYADHQRKDRGDLEKFWDRTFRQGLAETVLLW